MNADGHRRVNATYAHSLVSATKTYASRSRRMCAHVPSGTRSPASLAYTLAAAAHLANMHVSGNAGPHALVNTSSNHFVRAVAAANAAPFLAPGANVPAANAAAHAPHGAYVNRRSPGLLRRASASAFASSSLRSFFACPSPSIIFIPFASPRRPSLPPARSPPPRSEVGLGELAPLDDLGDDTSTELALCRLHSATSDADGPFSRVSSSSSPTGASASPSASPSSVASVSKFCWSRRRLPLLPLAPLPFARLRMARETREETSETTRPRARGARRRVDV